MCVGWLTLSLFKCPKNPLARLAIFVNLMFYFLRQNVRATALDQMVQSVITKVARVFVRPASVDGSVIDVKFNTKIFQTKDVNVSCSGK